MTEPNFLLPGEAETLPPHRLEDQATLPPPAPATTDLPRPFGRYRLERLLGQGGMGIVFLAHDTHLNRPVALKVPVFTGALSDYARQRFMREAQAAAALHHPNICPIHDVGEIDATAGKQHICWWYKCTRRVCPAILF